MKNANSSIPLSKISISDLFWDKYLKLIKEEIIPYQWNILNDQAEGVETSHCIANFRIAAREDNGDFQGAVFQDTDMAKWLEAVGFSLSNQRDSELEKLADDMIELIARAQQQDGYLNTYYTIKEPKLRWTNLKEGHELYTAGHFIEAAVAYYEATGKTRLLDVVSKFADLICNVFGSKDNQIHGYPGHQEIEMALVKLYRVTKKRKYLETAKYFIDARGVGENYFKKEEKTKTYKSVFPELGEYDLKYAQSDIPVRMQKKAAGHAVRAVYMYSAMADLAYEYQDAELMKACERIWDNIVQKQMYITGSIGSSGFLERFTTDYDLPNDCNYSETCASIGLAMFGKRMADIHKDASYIDVVERALYNTILAGIAMDGKSFFYVNPLEVWPDNCMEASSRKHIKPQRQPWFGVACCPPNIARTLASLGQYLYFQEENAVYINLYVANETEVKINDVWFRLEMQSEIPWKNEVIFKIQGQSEQICKFAFRIPEYAKNYQIYKNGSKMKLKIEKGYAVLDGKFKNDVVRIHFESPAKFVHANPQVRADAYKVAIVKGPLVYCLEEQDNGENLASLIVNTKQELKESYQNDILKGCTVIKLKGFQIKEERWDEKKLYQEKKTELIERELTAVPYCYWGNRNQGEMLVWMHELVDYVKEMEEK